MSKTFVCTLGLLALSLSKISTPAEAQSFRFDREPPKLTWRAGPRYEPPPIVSPHLTAFDRNMVPAANATPASDDYDLSERISFGKPKR